MIQVGLKMGTVMMLQTIRSATLMGSDCCGSNVNTDWCTECICYADLDCAAPLELIANGFCNDEANTAGCGYDGGDCCGDCVNTDVCTECTCFDGGALSPDISCESKQFF